MAAAVITRDPEESRAIAERLVKRYELADAKEYASRAYMLSLDPATRSFIRADRPMRKAILDAFYKVKSQEELDMLMTKTPDELAEIGKGR